MFALLPRFPFGVCCMRCWVIAVSGAIGLSAGMGQVYAQPAAQPAAKAAVYPSRPVRVIVSLPPGGGVDLVARTVAARLGEDVGTPFIVDNRPGAAGMLGNDIAAKSQPDGHTLLIATAPLTITPFLHPKMPYDAGRDFAPVTLLGTQRLLVVVHPSLKVNSVKELIALAKAKPGEMNIGIANPSGAAALVAALFKINTGTHMVAVPYNGAAPALVALMSNEVQVNFTTPAVAMPQAKSGKVKLLAITGKGRAPYLPEVPTLIEEGQQDFSGTWVGLVAPAKTPAGVIDVLHRRIVEALKVPSVRDRLASAEFEIAGNTPREFGAFISSQLETNGRVIKIAGLKAE
jgi:tripartite-type tricarboxylate transporter receptor subunit TctC